jgi:GLPGLI family protein
MRPASSNTHHTKLVINGSQSYYFTYRMNKNNYQVKIPLGKKFQPHTNYINTEKNILVSQFGDKYRVKEALINFNWRQLNDSITITGFLCKKAWCYYQGDSVVAAYSEKLPQTFGPMNFTGLPGTILELTRFKKDICFRTVAILIQDEALPITEPDDGKLITWEKWKKIIANRRFQNGIIRIVTF